MMLSNSRNSLDSVFKLRGVIKRVVVYFFFVNPLESFHAIYFFYAFTGILDQNKSQGF